MPGGYGVMRPVVMRPSRVVDLDALGLAVGNMRIGVAGLHRGREVRQIHLGGQAGDVVLGAHLVHVLAQVAQAHALVALVLLAELRKDPPHGLVAFVVVLELLQSRKQRVPPALGDADGEHDEEAVEARFLHDHAMLGQKLGDDARPECRFRQSCHPCPAWASRWST